MEKFTVEDYLEKFEEASRAGTVDLGKNASALTPEKFLTTYHALPSKAAQFNYLILIRGEEAKLTKVTGKIAESVGNHWFNKILEFGVKINPRNFEMAIEKSLRQVFCEDDLTFDTAKRRLDALAEHAMRQMSEGIDELTRMTEELPRNYKEFSSKYEKLYDKLANYSGEIDEFFSSQYFAFISERYPPEVLQKMVFLRHMLDPKHTDEMVAKLCKKLQIDQTPEMTEANPIRQKLVATQEVAKAFAGLATREETGVFPNWNTEMARVEYKPDAVKLIKKAFNTFSATGYSDKASDPDIATLVRSLIPYTPIKGESLQQLAEELLQYAQKMVRENKTLTPPKQTLLKYLINDLFKSEKTLEEFKEDPDGISRELLLNLSTELKAVAREKTPARISPIELPDFDTWSENGFQLSDKDTSTTGDAASAKPERIKFTPEALQKKLAEMRARSVEASEKAPDKGDDKGDKKEQTAQELLREKLALRRSAMTGRDSNNTEGTEESDDEDFGAGEAPKSKPATTAPTKATPLPHQPGSGGMLTLFAAAASRASAFGESASRDTAEKPPKIAIPKLQDLENQDEEHLEENFKSVAKQMSKPDYEPSDLKDLLANRGEQFDAGVLYNFVKVHVDLIKKYHKELNEEGDDGLYKEDLDRLKKLESLYGKDGQELESIRAAEKAPDATPASPTRPTK